MRTMTLAAGIVAVGALAALPFRRSEVPVDPNAPQGVATGPLARQMHMNALDTAVPWPSRPGFDASLAWQPQPMTVDISPRSFELPPMPEEYPLDAIEVPMPAAIGERFDAVIHRRQPVPSSDLVMPQTAPIEDRFDYTPVVEPPQPYRSAKVQSAVRSASVIGSDPQEDRPPAQRQYIREPQ